jgi:hypothetical protein
MTGPIQKEAGAGGAHELRLTLNELIVENPDDDVEHSRSA